MATNHENPITDETIVRRNVKRDLPCKLTEEEFTRIARQRATKEAERDELEEDLAKEKKRRLDQIAELDDEIGKMGRELRTGEQDRIVTCDEVFRVVDGTGFVFVIRRDSFTEVERRAASAHEAQRYLPGVDGPGASLLDQAAAQRERSAAPAETPAPESDGSDVPADGGGAGDDEDDDEQKPKRRGGRKGRE